MLPMTSQEISQLVNNYIGVSDDGYLGDFTYRTHGEFYPLYCDLDIYPDTMPGTTRSRFLDIVRSSTPQDQAKIVRGILKKYPSDTNHTLRTPEQHAKLLACAMRLEGGSAVSSPQTLFSSEVVCRAIADAETLLMSRGATSGVDRVHTAIHGYMKHICDKNRFMYKSEPSILAFFTIIREQHEAFKSSCVRADDVTKICRALGTIMDVLNPIRNKASVAHPNENLLEEAEAMLVINVTRSIIHYLDAKLSK